jgi:drug/metabolite transporter (DMT)-like permease
MKWVYVGIIVGATMLCDYLQASAVKSGGEISHASGLKVLFRQWRLPTSILFMALSFFSFTQLLALEDLSFAVPATALSIPAETLMARVFLKENVDGRRWAGSLLVACGVVLIAF